MRLAPEVLVFELFREVGYGDSREQGENSAQDYSDVIGELSEAERLLLSSCRGRRRKGRGRQGLFYAPPYVGLAKHAWFRKRTDRTMRDYFLGGPLAQAEAELDPGLVVRALRGHRSAIEGTEPKGKEVLSLIAIDEREDPTPEDMEKHLRASLGRRSAPFGRHEDPLASTIVNDFLELCRLEAYVPRREWLFFLISFLRTATSMWLLAHLRITVLVRDYLQAACEERGGASEQELVEAMRNRYQGLLHPTSTPSREVFEHVEEYMRARVELRLLVGQLDERHPEEFTSGETNKKLTLDSSGSDRVALRQLLLLGQNADWMDMCGGNSIRKWLVREAEKWPAWSSPRTRGQGKNIDEFLRVLYRSAEDDSGSGLLIRHSGATAAIVPGHRLLQLFAFLANRRKSRTAGVRNRGKLVLRDIEAHLFDYGIDFRSSSFGRPLLMDKLLEAGLLVGSPDAGESAEVLDTVGNRLE